MLVKVWEYYNDVVVIVEPFNDLALFKWLVQYLFKQQSQFWQLLYNDYGLIYFLTNFSVGHSSLSTPFVGYLAYHNPGLAKSNDKNCRQLRKFVYSHCGQSLQLNNGHCRTSIFTSFRKRHPDGSHKKEIYRAQSHRLKWRRTVRVIKPSHYFYVKYSRSVWHVRDKSSRPLIRWSMRCESNAVCSCSLTLFLICGSSRAQWESFWTTRIQ